MFHDGIFLVVVRKFLMSKFTESARTFIPIKERSMYHSLYKEQPGPQEIKGKPCNERSSPYEFYPFL